VHPGDLTRGCSDLEMTWLLCCAGAATEHAAMNNRYPTMCIFCKVKNYDFGQLLVMSVILVII